MSTITDETTALAASNHQFALDLYSRLRTRKGNLFFSPYSLWTALAMTYAGAHGPTARQMAAVLHFPFASQHLHPAFSALIKDLQAASQFPGCRLCIANALWGQQGYGFVSSFLQRTQQHYGAGLNEVDFAADHEAARRTINAWVEEQTEHRIQELLKPGIVDPLTRLVLTNAIYFRGAWALPFSVRLTRRLPFRTENGSEVPVPFMHRTYKVKYLQEKTFQAMELPYAGDRLNMVVFLPRHEASLAAFEQGLSAESLAGWMGRLRSQEVNIYLPRFKVTADFLLNDELSALGMPLAFDAEAADFSELDGGQKPGIFIAAVIHKAYVDVNEEGTEAASATGVVMAPRAAAPRELPEFRADHSFLFLIRDSRTGSILFLGRLANPQG